MARMALCPLVRPVTRSQEQEWADESCVGSPMAFPLCTASRIPAHRLWGGTQRKRRDGSSWNWMVGQEPAGLHRPHCPPHPKWAVAASRTACLPLASSSHRHSCSARQGQLGPQFRLQYWSTEGSRERGARRVQRGVGWQGQNTSWTHVLHPGGSLSYPASVCPPMEWAPAGDSGDRGARWRLRAQLCPGWLQSCPHGLLGATASASACGDGGGPGPGRAVGTRPRRVACPT